MRRALSVTTALFCGTVVSSCAGTRFDAAASASAAEGAKVFAVSALPYVRSTDPRYQSFQIGFSHLTGGETWKSYDSLPKDGNTRAGGFEAIREARAKANLNTPRLIALTSALAPLYIRYSGTTANSVYFQDSDTPPPAKAPEGYTVVLTRAAWKDALAFAKAVDAKVVTSFANSPAVRDAAGKWTPVMAKAWLDYTLSIGGSVYAAELFNEPNAPEPPRILKGHTAEEFARDYLAFEAAMKSMAPSMKRAGPGTVMLGVPGGGAIQGITSEKYAQAVAPSRFDIISYHFYPALAQRCAPENSPMGISADKALSEDWLARPDAELKHQVALRNAYAPGAPIWLTETGGAACGGVRWQQTYLDMFRYLDSLGRQAKGGLDAIFTHALISGSNGIIDEKTFEPNASYWGAVLWSRLMDNRVLDAGANGPGLHTYAHCLRGRKGGVALLAINLSAAPTTISVGRSAQVYALSATRMEDRSAMLNGTPLSIGSDNRLPAMKPVPSKTGTLALAPHTITFVAVPDAGNANCPAR